MATAAREVEVATMEVQEHHLGFAFSVTIGEVTEGQIDTQAGEWGCPREETWLYDIRAIVKALCADKRRLDTYIAYRCAWSFALDEGFEGHGLCSVLEVPTDEDDLLRFLLGLHLPPRTRAHLKWLSSLHDDDTPGCFIEEIEQVIVVSPSGMWHHKAA